MTAPVPFTARNGAHLTLDDLAEFVSTAIAAGLPGTTPVRVLGAVDPVSLSGLMTGGPRISAIVPDPAEVPS